MMTISMTAAAAAAMVVLLADHSVDAYASSSSIASPPSKESLLERTRPEEFLFGNFQVDEAALPTRTPPTFVYEENHGLPMVETAPRLLESPTTAVVSATRIEEELSVLPSRSSRTDSRKRIPIIKSPKLKEALPSNMPRKRPTANTPSRTLGPRRATKSLIVAEASNTDSDSDLSARSSVSPFPVADLPTSDVAMHIRGQKIGLTREEEVAFSFRIRSYRTVMKLREQMVKEQAGMFVHPKEQQWAVAAGRTVAELRRILAEGQEARAAMVAANIGLVTSVAKRHYHALKQASQSDGGVGTILTLADMVQEGNVGLVLAAERFEPEKGFRFSTYATYWIRQRILASISDSSRTIRLPSHVHVQMQKIRKEKRRLYELNGRQPSLQELAQCLEMSVEKLQRYTDSSRNVVSLESPVGRPSAFKDDRRTLGDSLVARDIPTPAEFTEFHDLRCCVHHVLHQELMAPERQVLTARYGLEDGTSRTVDETAQALGISRDRVRVVEARALHKLRSPQRHAKLLEFVVDHSHHHHGSSSSSSRSSTKDSSSMDGKSGSSSISSSLSRHRRPRRSGRTDKNGNDSDDGTVGSVASADRMWF